MAQGGCDSLSGCSRSPNGLRPNWLRTKRSENRCTNNARPPIAPVPQPRRTLTDGCICVFRPSLITHILINFRSDEGLKPEFFRARKEIAGSQGLLLVTRSTIVRVSWRAQECDRPRFTAVRAEIEVSITWTAASCAIAVPRHTDTAAASPDAGCPRWHCTGEVL